MQLAVSPDALPHEILKIAKPDETALLDVLRTRVSRLMLEEIASNDYGEGALDHLEAIEAQMGRTPPLGLPGWCPREVLELERWNEPEEGGAERDRLYAHLKRLLACTILLRNSGHLSPCAPNLSEEDFFLETSAASVLRLLQSSIALGSFFERPALAFCLWLYLAQPYPKLRPFVALCLALLAFAVSPSIGTSGTELTLLGWVDAVEETCRGTLGSNVQSERWLVGLNAYEPRPEAWLDTIHVIALEVKYRSDCPLLSWANGHFSR